MTAFCFYDKRATSVYATGAIKARAGKYIVCRKYKRAFKALRKFHGFYEAISMFSMAYKNIYRHTHTHASKYKLKSRTRMWCGGTCHMPLYLQHAAMCHMCCACYRLLVCSTTFPYGVRLGAAAGGLRCS